MKEICLDVLCGLSVILVVIVIGVSITGIVYFVTTYTRVTLGLLVIWFLYVIGHDIRNT